MTLLLQAIDRSLRVVVRDYEARDLDAVRKIHADSNIDYRFPDLSSPLFVVTKVVEVDNVVRACGGVYLAGELYLWLDKSEWGTPQEKFAAIQELDRVGMDAIWLRGIDQCCLWLPPGMSRFGERLRDLGFEPDRDGWKVYSKMTAPK